MTRSRSRSLAKGQEVAREEGFQVDWQSEKDRRRLLELTGIKGQEVVAWEVAARLDGCRGNATKSVRISNLVRIRPYALK